MTAIPKYQSEQKPRNRELNVYNKEPTPEFLKIMGGLAHPTARLVMIVDGKEVVAHLSRRRLFHLIEECAAALKAMEPGV